MSEKNKAERVPSGLAKGVAAGLSGEDVSFAGVLAAIGGIRGVIEALLPGIVYLVTFILTEDAKVSVIAPSILAGIIIILRVVARQTLLTAVSGVLGVAIAVATTLFTGKGEDFFLPGFWINGAWLLALSLSLLFRWPLIGFLAGLLQNDPTGWKKAKTLYAAAYLTTVIWLMLFVVRLAVQLPLYFSGNVAALGVARLTMGTPLFALVVLLTWIIFRKNLGAARTK